MRRAMRAFGDSYFKRCQAYVGVCYFWAISAMLSLNVIFWSSLHHHMATIIYIMANTFLICHLVLSGITDATKLQACTSTHRMVLKNESLALTQRIMDLELTLCASFFTGGEHNAKDLMSPISPRLDLEGSASSSKTPSTAAIREQLTKLEKTKDLLKSADDIIGYQDEVHEPVTVMSFEATNGVFNSTVGVILTFLVLAVEGFSGNVGYDSEGWSIAK